MEKEPFRLYISAANTNIRAVVASPITIAVNTKADGIGSITSLTELLILTAESKIGAVLPLIYPKEIIIICTPVSAI